MHHPTDRIAHSRGAVAGTRNSSIGPPHEGSIRRPIAPSANALTTELHIAPSTVLDLIQMITSSKKVRITMFGSGESLTFKAAVKVEFVEFKKAFDTVPKTLSQ